MARSFIIYLSCILACLLSSCISNVSQVEPSSCDYAKYFDVVELVDSVPVKAIVVISPYDNLRDTLIINKVFNNIICMSSSQVAGLAEIGADSLITAVSGLKYISNPNIRNRATKIDHLIYDIGYEATLDYETILKLDPDVLLTYTVSGAEPQYISKLRSLGVPVLVLHDHLENHPLARAEYIKLYGALVGKEALADSIYNAIRDRYNSLAEHAGNSEDKIEILMNVPFGDAWYIPGGDSYMAKLIHDAGGIVLGAESGTSVSRVIRMEEAYSLSQTADIWLNPGVSQTRDELIGYHHAFRHFGPIVKELPIYNNTLRTTPEGGNDFWESGSVRPDLILEDLISIFSSTEQDFEGALKYHFKVE